MNILFVGDLHTRNPISEEDAVFSEIRQFANDVDMIVLGGDLTENGYLEEYANVRSRIVDFRHKTVLIRGNHDLGFFMNEMRDYFDFNVPVNFEPFSIPLLIWQSSWYEVSKYNFAVLDMPYTLPAPYNQTSQPPVVILADGIGPYYSFKRDGFKFIFLDTLLYVLGKQQQEWLLHEIVQSDLPIVIFMHHSILPTGSIVDSCMLWDREPLLEQLISHPHILGVFSGHVHYNRRWDVYGRKVVTTAERGGMRMISLKGNEITSMEIVGHCINGRGESARKKDLSPDPSEEPFMLRHSWPTKIISPRTFRVHVNHDQKLWGKDIMGWHDPQAPGGLEWSWPSLAFPAGNPSPWFGIQFVSHSTWKLTLRKNNVVIMEKNGKGCGNLITLTEPIDTINGRHFCVRLEQAPPAIGHAFSYIVFNNQPVTQFNSYD